MRICDNCGKEREVKGGKTCSNGHFVCAKCVYGGILGGAKTSCPLCGKRLK